MGLGAAMVFPATLSLIANIFTERKARARAIGLWGASAGAAIALGPIVGGWLLEHFSWSAIFYALAPVAAISAVLVAVAVPTSRDLTSRSIDVVGFVASTLAMGALVFTIIEAPDYGWTATRTLAGFAAAAGLFTAFVLWERRLDHPMLDIGLFRKARFSAASGSVTIAFFTLFGFIFLMTQYFQFIQTYTPLGTGVRLLPVAASVGVASVIGTKLAVRFGTKVVVATGLACITAFYVWVALVISASTGYGVIAAQMVLYGIGMGLTSAPATESIMGAVSTKSAGIGSAVNDATRLLGGTLGVAVIGSVFASLYKTQLASTLPGGLPGPISKIAQQSVGAALSVAQRATSLGRPALGAGIRHAATDSFIHGISVACLVAGGVAAAGVLMAAFLLPAQPPSAPSPASTDLESPRTSGQLDPVPVDVLG
jgi:predicted MFS family arabinose efflux permease